MPNVDRLATTDALYRVGELSPYPVSLDNQNTLYQVANNATTVLTQSISYTSTFLVVDSTASFPPQGILSVGTELIYYNSTSPNLFQDLKRGFAGSRQNVWPKGTTVTNSVAAEVHNAVKDALINIETNLGTQLNPTAISLNGILDSLETRFLAPQPVFKASLLKGPPPLTVVFQNFSTGAPLRFLWDFGDGAQSVDVSPIHTYLSEGIYTVNLNMISSLGAQGIATKTNYIEVNKNDLPAFFYVTPMIGTHATTFSFVDQTDGNIASRFWIFDDGNTQSALDPTDHVTTHIYATPGTYNPTLLVVFNDQSLKRLTLTDPIVVTS